MHAPQSEDRVLLLRRLVVIVDEHRPDFVRRATIAEIQQMLQLGHPLRSKSPAELLAKIKQPWGTRLYLEGGHAIEKRVQRPPQSINDLW
jgi:hypothetical protein